MADNDQTRPPTNVIDFPQIGFRLAPTTTLDPAPGPDAVPAPTAPGTGGRRSPLDLLNALPAPGILQPAITPTATPTTGLVPDTFRNTDPDTHVLPSAGMGALSMAAILAIAVAALRGSHTVLSTWWEQRQARYAETAELRQARAQQALERAKTSGQHEQAMQAIADKQAQQRAKNSRVPSSSEYGRKTLGNRSSGGTGGGGSRGGQSNTPAGRRSNGNGSGGGAGRGPAAHRNNTGRGNSNGPGSGVRNNRTPANHRLNTPKNPGGKGRDDRKKPTDKPGLRNPPASGTRQPTDRTAARQEARRERQRARLQRTAERQQGRLQERAKDRAAARDLKYENKRKQAADKEQAKEQKKQATADRNATGPGRTTLAAAVSRQARRRLKRRRRHLDPPVLSTVKGKKKPKTKKTSTVKTKTKAPKSKKTPKTSATKPGPGTRAGRGRWDRIRVYARRKTTSTGCFGGTTAPTSGATTGPGTTGTGGSTRRSPFENAAHATVDPEYTVTGEYVPSTRTDQPGPAALSEGQPVITSTGPAALDAAPTVNPPRPGTTRPKEPIAMPPASREPAVVIAKAQKGAAKTARAAVGRRMAAQHETEITLDDACDAGDKLATKAFKIHDQADKLAHQSERLRDAWIVLAEDCAEQHNLIGDGFTHASIRFGESMEMVRRTALEMSSASLTAAEKAETAANEINDAYRPINTATADQGLSTPSAPAHNEV